MNFFQLFFDSEELYAHVLRGYPHDGADFVVAHVLQPHHHDGPVDQAKLSDAFVELTNLRAVGVVVLEEVDVHGKRHSFHLFLLFPFL